MNETMLLEEIWREVCVLLPQRDLKCLTVTNKMVGHLARRKLWYQPRFKCREGPISSKLDTNDMLKIAVYNVPIRVLKLSQFNNTSVAEPRYITPAELVDLLLPRFPQLSDFILDSARLISIDTVRIYLKLPVKQLETWMFAYSTKPSQIDDWLDFLAGLDPCPWISIHESFHWQLTLEHFRKLVKLPVNKIKASFKDAQLDLDAYDQLISSIDPPPQYILCRAYQELYPGETLSKLKRTKISTVHGGYFAHLPCSELGAVLRKNDQTPSLWINNNKYGISLADFKSLQGYRIDYLATNSLKKDAESFNDFLDAIIGHHQTWGIGKLMIRPGLNKTLFDEAAVEKLENAGLCYEILPS